MFLHTARKGQTVYNSIGSRADPSL